MASTAFRWFLTGTRKHVETKQGLSAFMPRTNFEDYESDLEETGQVTYLRNLPRQKKYAKPRVPRNIYQKHELIADVHAQEDNNFDISYKAARHEAEWLGESLRLFYEQQWFERCAAHGQRRQGGFGLSVPGKPDHRRGFPGGQGLPPAPLPQPAQRRSTAKAAATWTNRARDHQQAACATPSASAPSTGASCCTPPGSSTSSRPCARCTKPEADVPRPFASDSNTILMEYYGDEVMGAPTLNDVSLTARRGAGAVRARVHNIDLMLPLGASTAISRPSISSIGNGEIVLIDFPQAIHPEKTAAPTASSSATCCACASTSTAGFAPHPLSPPVRAVDLV
jgi:hypothetical protein